jgi:hypothetical protein
MKRMKFYFFVLLSISFVGFRFHYYREYAALFNALSAALIMATIYGIYRSISQRDRTLSLRVSLEDLVKKRFGQAFGGYLIYEIKLVAGLFKFIISPRKTYQAIMSSYFASPMLSGVLIGLLLILVSESVLIHLFITVKFEGTTKLVLTLLFLLSEVFFLEMTLGNLYYFQFSKFEISDNRISIRQGLLWDVNFGVHAIRHLEWGNLRQMNDKTPKISLFQDSVVRIHLLGAVKAKRIFREKDLTSLDIYLKDVDQEHLRSAMSGLETKSI